MTVDAEFVAIIIWFTSAPLRQSCGEAPLSATAIATLAESTADVSTVLFRFESDSVKRTITVLGWSTHGILSTGSPSASTIGPLAGSALAFTLEAARTARPLLPSLFAIGRLPLQLSGSRCSRIHRLSTTSTFGRFFLPPLGPSSYRPSVRTSNAGRSRVLADVLRSQRLTRTPFLFPVDGVDPLRPLARLLTQPTPPSVASLRRILRRILRRRPSYQRRSPESSRWALFSSSSTVIHSLCAAIFCVDANRRLALIVSPSLSLRPGCSLITTAGLSLPFFV